MADRPLAILQQRHKRLYRLSYANAASCVRRLSADFPILASQARKHRYRSRRVARSAKRANRGRSYFRRRIAGQIFHFAQEAVVSTKRQRLDGRCPDEGRAVQVQCVGEKLSTAFSGKALE